MKDAASVASFFLIQTSIICPFLFGKYFLYFMLIITRHANYYSTRRTTAPH